VKFITKGSLFLFSIFLLTTVMELKSETKTPINSNVLVSDAWVRAMPPGSMMTAAFFKITNPTDKTLIIKAITSDLAGDCSVHRTINENGLNKMIAVDQLQISPHSSIEFAPGGLHVMIMALKKPLIIGSPFPLMIHFEEGGSVMVNAKVLKQ